MSKISKSLKIHDLLQTEKRKPFKPKEVFRLRHPRTRRATTISTLEYLILSNIKRSYS